MKRNSDRLFAVLLILAGAVATPLIVGQYPTPTGYQKPYLGGPTPQRGPPISTALPTTGIYSKGLVTTSPSAAIMPRGMPSVSPSFAAPRPNYSAMANQEFHTPPPLISGRDMANFAMRRAIYGNLRF